jgi:hypothetical protein
MFWGGIYLDQQHVITVAGKVADESVYCKPDLKGEMHQHFYVDLDEVLEGDSGLVDNTMIFVAARFGDSDGFLEPVPCLAPGKPIIIRGKFIPSWAAYKTEDNPGYPVLHFTHHPLGYIIYDGVKYE